MAATLPKTKVKALKGEILAYVSSGQTVRAFCRENDISPPTVYEWIRTDKEFREDMELARQIGVDALADEALYIAYNTEEGTETESGQTPMGFFSKTKRGDMLGHRKLKIHTILQLAAKWHPTKYGTSPEGPPPPPADTNIIVTIVPPDPVD